MVRFPHPNLISEQTPIVMLFVYLKQKMFLIFNWKMIYFLQLFMALKPFRDNIEFLTAPVFMKV